MTRDIDSCLDICEMDCSWMFLMLVRGRMKSQLPNTVARLRAAPWSDKLISDLNSTYTY